MADFASTLSTATQSLNTSTTAGANIAHAAALSEASLTSMSSAGILHATTWQLLPPIALALFAAYAFGKAVEKTTKLIFG